MKSFSAIVVSFLVLSGYSQKLSINDLKKIDSLNGNELKFFLVKKGYNLIKNWKSDTTWDKGSVYGYQLTVKDIKKAELEGTRLINIYEVKMDGKWQTFAIYKTPDQNEIEDFRTYCTKHNFKRVWSPTPESLERESYELHSGNVMIMIDLVRDNSEPEKKSCYQIAYKSTKIN
jgi:hypothetical protein